MSTKKKKILHIIQSLDNGGCENMLLRTLPFLSNFEHKIITLKEFGELTPKFISAGITVKTMRCHHLFDLSGMKRLRTLVRQENPNIILTYLFHADMVGRFLLHGSTPAPIVPFLRTTYNHPKYFGARLLEWLTKPLVKQYLANSEAVKNFYVKTLGVSPKKVIVIPNGIDIEYFNSLTPNPTLRPSLGVAANDFLIICVANLAKNKGHRYLLEAFEEVSQRKKDIPLKLLLIGDGTERKNLEQQKRHYHSRKNILFLGKRSDVPEILKISNAFVLPTLFEGQSNAILEAMAARLPIITTDIPENRVLLENDVSGKLVIPQSSPTLTQALAEVIEDDTKSSQLAQKAHAIIKKEYTLKEIAEQFQSVLLALL